MALQFGTSTALTITAANLGSASNRSSAAVTTDTTKNITQILVTVRCLMTVTQTSGAKQIIVYGYMSEDGTNYLGASANIDNVDGTDKALTALGSPSALKVLGIIPTNNTTNAITLTGVFEIVQVFGAPPPKWGIVLFNDCGTALGATISASYRIVYYS